MVAVIGALVVLTTVNGLITPVPEAGSPILALLFVHS